MTSRVPGSSSLVSIVSATRLDHVKPGTPRRGKYRARSAGSGMSCASLTSAAPSLAPKKFRIGCRALCCHVRHHPGRGGAPTPSRCTGRGSGRRSRAAPAAGAAGSAGRAARPCRRHFAAIWARKTGRSSGWCMTSLPRVSSHGTSIPPMPDMLTSGKGFSSGVAVSQASPRRRSRMRSCSTGRGCADFLGLGDRPGGPADGEDVVRRGLCSAAWASTAGRVGLRCLRMADNDCTLAGRSIADVR